MTELTSPWTKVSAGSMCARHSWIGKSTSLCSFTLEQLCNVPREIPTNLKTVVRHFAIPTVDYQPNWIFRTYRPTSHGTGLRVCLFGLYFDGGPLGSSPTTGILCGGTPLACACWVYHCHCNRSPRG